MSRTTEIRLSMRRVKHELSEPYKRQKSGEARDSDFICRGERMRVARRRIAEDKAEENFASVFLIARFCVRLRSADRRLSFFRTFVTVSKASTRIKCNHEKIGVANDKALCDAEENTEGSPRVVVFQTISINHRESIR